MSGNGFTPGPVSSVGELIARLQQLDPQIPVLVDGYEGGYSDARVDVAVVQKLSGMPDFYGRFMTPEEAAFHTGPSAWESVKDFPTPILVGDPVTALVLRRIGQPDEAG
jgi:hypothetical protein